jgi:hypothetical protein
VKGDDGLDTTKRIIILCDGDKRLMYQATGDYDHAVTIRELQKST